MGFYWDLVVFHWDFDGILTGPSPVARASAASAPQASLEVPPPPPGASPAPSGNAAHFGGQRWLGWEKSYKNLSNGGSTLGKIS